MPFCSRAGTGERSTRLMKALDSIAGLVLVVALPCSAVNWPQFRGSDGLGIGEGAEPPTHFGAASNVLWKTALPAGHSSPCIWGNRIFLTGFAGKKLETIALDRTTGTVLSRETAPAERIEPAHRIANPAASTPATDGDRIYSYFGSFGLITYDFDGKELWRMPLPPPILGWFTAPLLQKEAESSEPGRILVAAGFTIVAVWAALAMPDRKSTRLNSS